MNKYINKLSTIILIIILMGIVIGGYYYARSSIEKNIEEELKKVDAFVKTNFYLLTCSNIDKNHLIKLLPETVKVYDDSIAIYHNKILFLKSKDDSFLYFYPLDSLFISVHEIFPHINVKVIYEDSVLWSIGKITRCSNVLLCKSKTLYISKNITVSLQYVGNKMSELIKMFHPIVIFIIFALIIIHLNSKLTKMKQIKRGYRIVDLLQSISIGFGVKDSNGEILYGNDIFMSSSDLTKDETVINDRLYGIYKESIDKDTMYLLVDKTEEYESKRFDEAVEEIAVFSLYSMEENKVKNMITEVIGNLLSCDRVSIYCKHDDVFRKDIGWYRNKEEAKRLDKLFIREEDFRKGLNYSRDNFVIIDDLKDTVISHVIDMYDVRSFIAVPIYDEIKDINGLIICGKKEPHKWNDREIRFFRKAANIYNLFVQKISIFNKLKNILDEYSFIVNGVQDIVYQLDEEGRIKYLSPEWEREMDTPLGSALGLPLHNFIHEEDRSKYIDSLNEGKEVVCRFKTRNGYKYYLLKHEKHSMYKGYVYIGIARDITSRVMYEKELKNVTEEYKQMLNTLYEGIAWIGEDGTLRLFNDAFVYLCGYESEEEFKKQKIEDIFKYVDSDDMKKEIENNIKKSKEIKKFLRFTINEIPVVMNIVPFYWSNRRDGVIITMMDISEYETMQKKLVEAQKMEAIGFLASGIAHDFNNLLAIIRGNADLLSLTDKEELKNKYISEILKSVDTAKELVENIRLFSTSIEEEVEIVDVISILENVIKVSSIGKNIEIEFNVKENEAMLVKAIRSSLSQVFLNILKNAIEAVYDIDNGKVWVDVYLSINKDKVVIDIGDNGESIDPEIRDHIFDPFFTSHDKSYKKGKGMGLTIANAIVREMGGVINVKSNEEETVFTIEIPLVSMETTGESKDNISVLLIDDDKMLTEVGSTLLTKLGVSVDIAMNGKEAIDTLKNKQYDILLIDLIMAGSVDGIGVLEWIKENKYTAHKVVITGYMNDVLKKKLKKLGVEHILLKPFGIDQLRIMLEEYKKSNINMQ